MPLRLLPSGTCIIDETYMPELPEVETIARDLNQTVLSKKITAVKVNDPYIIKGLNPKSFIGQIKGAVICGVYRRGKALVLTLSNQLFWVVQPMMTGQMVYVYPHEQPALLKETRLIVTLADGGTLLYNDQRRFGHLRLVRDINSIKYFKIIGPEPLTDDLTEDYLLSRIQASTRPIKNILLDHTVIAGIGNIYASEILFRTRISPLRCGSTIRKQDIVPLIKNIRAVLSEAIVHRGSSMRNYRDGRGQKGAFNKLIQVYARIGQACVVCQRPIIRVVQSGRSTFYCKHCQQ